MPAMSETKKQWQRANRASFKAKHGYSSSANYGAGGLREQILDRDHHRCVKCGMTEAEHLEKLGRPITIDHIDKDRSRNVDENLQTLCLTCHGRKDLIALLRVQKVPLLREEILRLRAAGTPYQQIADSLNLSIGSVWKWVKRWEDA